MGGTVVGMPVPFVVSTATMTCTFGAAPSVLTVLPTAKVLVEGRPLCAIADQAAMVNIPPFGMCSSLANPAVASATAAAQGVLTPQPCTPVPTAPWQPGVPLVLVGGKPAVAQGAQLVCSFGGAIAVGNPGATRTMG